MFRVKTYRNGEYRPSSALTTTARAKMEELGYKKGECLIADAKVVIDTEQPSDWESILVECKDGKMFEVTLLNDGRPVEIIEKFNLDLRYASVC